MIDITETELRDLYINKHLSWRAIEALKGIPESSLRFYARKFNIPSRTHSEAQIAYLSTHGSQRTGTLHSQEAKAKIAASRIRNK